MLPLGVLNVLWHSDTLMEQHALPPYVATRWGLNKGRSLERQADRALQPAVMAGLVPAIHEVSLPTLTLG